MAQRKDAVIVVTQEGDGIKVVVNGAGALTFNPLNVHPDNRHYAEFHGWKQRFVDAAAMSRDTKTGLPATPMEKFDAIQALIAHYESGSDKWTRVAEGGPHGGYLFEALCKLFGHKKSPTEIRTWLAGLSDKEQAALREDDTVAPVLAAIKAEKTKDQPKVDTKAILQGL